MAACVAALCGISSKTFRASLCFRISCPIVDQKQRCPANLKYSKKVRSYSVVIRSVLKKVKSQTSNGDNGATKHSGFVLERLFAKTQKLEEMVSGNSNFSGGAELTMNLEILGRDLQTMLSALRKKEDDFNDAERRVLHEQARLNRMKDDMERQEKDISAASANQRQLEESLKRVNRGLASESIQIEDLKFMLTEQSKKMSITQSLVVEKENELNELRDQLAKKNVEVNNVLLQLALKEKTLEEANVTIKEQEAKINDIECTVKEKEYELSESVRMRNSELERLKNLEADLEKQTMVWSLARNELRKLTEQASDHLNDMRETSEDFNRVGSLLRTVRSELISMQESVATSWKKMEDRELQLKKRFTELDEEKLILMSYCQKLEAARLEFETERAKLIATKAHHQDLESQVSSSMKKINHLEEELATTRTSLEQKSTELAFLKDAILEKEIEYDRVQNLLLAKEHELVEARFQIQQMESEMVSLQVSLEEKDASLLRAQMELTKLKHDIMELQRLMCIKEEQLTQATVQLQEREEHIQELRQELYDTKFKVYEATSIVQQILQLTEELVSTREAAARLSLSNETALLYMEQDASNKNRELKSELEMLKDSLKQKESQVFSAKRALVAKEEELNVALRRWETSEKERTNISENSLGVCTGVKRVYNHVKERLGDGSEEAFKIGTLQNEFGILEVEAAAVALQNLEDLIHHLEVQTGYISGTHTNSSFSMSAESGQLDGNRVSSLDKKVELSRDIVNEVTRLFALTERLMVEAGINGAELQCS